MRTPRHPWFSAASTLGLALVASSTLFAQRRGAPETSGGVLGPLQACFDVEHYGLTLAIDPEERAIEGTLAMTATATTDTDAILLDLEGHLAVRGVSVAGADAEYAHTGGKIHIQLPAKVAKGDSLEVSVRYGGKPRVAPGPPWDGGFTWKRTASGGHWIATSCQINGADLWWPCKDHPSDEADSFDLHVTVPANLYVAANGKLVSDETSGDERTFHWHVSVPINNYGIALSIADYRVIERKYESVCGDEIDTYFFALPESEQKAREAFPHFLDQLRHLEETCGPYPWRRDKYAVVETPFLGMEHQTIIAYGAGYRLADDGYDWLHHHEMSHEWWGNLVTCRDWKDMWIHEGIGTYMQALYMEKTRGPEAYRAQMARTMRGLRNRLAVAPREVQDIQRIYRGHEIYTKGSCVMHSLRWVMGDERFFVALRRFCYPDPALEEVTDGSVARLVDTEELRGIAEKYHGADLGWFFEVYLRQGKLPRLIDRREGGTLFLEWEVPVEVEFSMPVEVRVDGEAQRVEMPGGKAELEVPEGATLEIDPHQRMLRQRPRRAREDRR